MCEAWDGAVKLQAQIEGRVIAQELAPKMAEEMAAKMAEEMAAKIAKDMAADMAPKMAESAGRNIRDFESAIFKGKEMVQKFQ